MNALLLTNFYHFALGFTAVYCFVFIVLLADRVRYSLIARAFAAFLFSIQVWALKDSVVVAFHPFVGERSLEFMAVALSPMFLLVLVTSANLFMNIYNSAVDRKRAFPHVRATNIILGVVIGLVYIVALWIPGILYSDFTRGAFDYHYAPGPGMVLFVVLLVVAVGGGGIFLMGLARRDSRFEAFALATVGLLSLIFILAANFAPRAAGFRGLPRLGALSVFPFCFISFFMIYRHSNSFSIRRVLEEHRKLKIMGESLRGLVGKYDEEVICRSICDYSQEVSDSVYVCMMIFEEDGANYRIRALSHSPSPGSEGAYSQLPLKVGKRYKLRPGSTLEMLKIDRQPHTCGGIREFFRGELDPGEATELDRSARIRQVIGYPIVLDEQVRGAIVFFRSTKTEAFDIYGIFSTQCALVLKFSAQISQLEEKQRLEDMLHHSQKMDALGQLAGGIAHDFNNMLAGITGYANLIKRWAVKDPQKVATFVDTILNASERASDLVNKLLAFARKGKYQVVIVDVHKSIEEVIAILEHTLDKRIRIEQNCQASPSTVSGDPGQIQNAFLNLALNARDAMPEGGVLTFSTRIESLQVGDTDRYDLHLKPGEYLVVSVGDTGVGMNPDTLSHIYEPFFTTKDVGKGTGLGLASVYGCVKSHSGYINVKSEPGRGTAFQVHIPLLRESIQHVPEKGSETRGVVVGKGHVLVVDDEEIIRGFCRELLTDSGYTVTECSDGLEAVEYFQKHHKKVDVAIVDMIMPRMSGVDCIREIRRIDPELRVILSTGYDFTNKTQHLISSGITGFLQKPFRESDLLKAVGKIFEEETAG